MAPVTPAPAVPTWSTSPWVRFAPSDASGERAVVVDTPGGTLDTLLADPDVATVLNDRFVPIFLHPTSVPAFTARTGSPALAVLDDAGCLRLHSPAPDSADALVDTLNEALRRRTAGTGQVWPAPGPLPAADPAWAAPPPATDCPRDLPATMPNAQVSPLVLPAAPDVGNVPTER